MTPDKFRSLALSLPEVVEGEHMNHPDFRIGGKIFATLCVDDRWGMVKITPELQSELIKKHEEVFQPANGAWGRNGATLVFLKKARKDVVMSALVAAWKKTAPKKLADLL